MEVSEKVKVLQDLIKIHSVNGNEVEVAHYLQKLLSKNSLNILVLGLKLQVLVSTITMFCRNLMAAMSP